MEAKFLYMAKQISAEAFGTRYKPLEDRAKQLDEEIPRQQAEVDLLKIAFLSKDELAHNAKDLYSQWSNLPYDEKRKIAQSLTHKIIVGKGEISIDLCYLPSVAPSPHPSQNVAKGQRNFCPLNL